MKRILAICLILLLLVGCHSDQKTENVEPEPITKIDIKDTISKEDIQKESDIDKLKQMIETLQEQNKQLQIELEGKNNEIVSLKQSMQLESKDNNSDVLLNYILAINNKDSQLIGPEALSFYENHLKDKPIDQVEVDAMKDSYKLLNADGQYIIVSIKNDQVVDGTLNYAKQANQFVNTYLGSIKQRNVNKLITMLYPNFQKDNSDFPTFIKQDVKALIDNYNHHFDLQSMQPKCENIIDDYGKNVIFEFVIEGERNNQKSQHKLLISYTFDNVYIYDYWDNILNTAMIKTKGRSVELVDEPSDVNFPNTKANTLNNGHTVMINEKTITIKDDLQVVKYISMPEGVHSANISHDGNHLVFATDRGLYVSDLEFKNVRQLLAQTGDLFAGTPVWSKDDQQIIFWLFGYQWTEGIGIIGVDGKLKTYVSELYEWEYLNWDLSKQQVFLQSTLYQNKKGLLDYKNYKLYTITEKAGD